MNISAYRRRPSATKETPVHKAIESTPKVTASRTRQHNPRKQSSKKVLKVRKYHYLYNVSDPMIWNGHIDESVFALSFQENVVVFNEYKDKPTAPFICICLRVFNTQQYRCGDCFRLFILRFYHNLLEDKRRNGLHTFFLFVNIIIAGATMLHRHRI